MLTFFRTNTSYIWLVLFLLSICPFVARIFDQRPPDTCGAEKFDPALGNLNSIDEVLTFADAHFKGASMINSADTVQYVLQLSELFKNRFCHGELNFRFSENWIAWTAGKLFWSHFSSMVLTKDVMKHSKCLCNQQTLAFMEALHQKGISSRSVGLGDKVPGHFLCEVRYAGSWHLFDISLEPNWDKIEQPHRELDYYMANKDLFYKVYEGRIPRSLFDAITVKHAYGEPDDFPGKKMKFFQATCEILTYLLPLFSLFMFFVSRKKRASTKKATNASEHRFSSTVQK